MLNGAIPSSAAAASALLKSCRTLLPAVCRRAIMMQVTQVGPQPAVTVHDVLCRRTS